MPIVPGNKSNAYINFIDHSILLLIFIVPTYDSLSEFSLCEQQVFLGFVYV
jgi:hypothetical protein